ncbi:hypothetical protein BD289DRAFT_163587 [Coniella lustricola]|uniref:Uncharacterized protein n=1 Tax=Coniella lustricola TaxID=2025994 RepID=A0A2T3AEE7_9PEZI|nr:hypothetical protein BD289DRAFT_163587 [Coniella lustricola]
MRLPAQCPPIQSLPAPPADDADDPSPWDKAGLIHDGKPCSKKPATSCRLPNRVRQTTTALTLPSFGTITNKPPLFHSYCLVAFAAILSLNQQSVSVRDCAQDILPWVSRFDSCKQIPSTGSTISISPFAGSTARQTVLHQRRSASATSRISWAPQHSNLWATKNTLFLRQDAGLARLCDTMRLWEAEVAPAVHQQFLKSVRGVPSTCWSHAPTGRISARVSGTVSLPVDKRQYLVLQSCVAAFANLQHSQ